ncbi:MAG: imidazolonepropionase [Saprospiraceae bacterium]|nr:imidazolonepropionase [Saprospiraceae bacterium]
MTKRHFINIERIINPIKTPLSPLRGEALNVVEHIDNAFITVTDGMISQLGRMADFSAKQEPVTDMSSQWILPCWVDSHTHTVFAKYRSEEFRQRMQGRSYQEIAASGGGILNSARRLSDMSEDELLKGAVERLQLIIGKGTGAVEIKSGYGLTLEDEIKMLRVIKKLGSISPIPVKATFLGAHALPAKYKDRRTDYLDLICHEMIPQIASEGLADYCDAFCETGYFTVDETERVIQKAAEFDIKAKIHTNQFTSIGGIQMAVRNGAKSVDHLEIMTDEDITSLSNSDTIATLLPIAPFFLKDPYPRGRQMADANCALALASDFNPGSAPSHDMALAINLACNYCGLTPEEAFNSATINGAHAMDIQAMAGTISVGYPASFVAYRQMESLAEIPYRVCSELIENVIIKGEFYDGKI